ncbi:hypothetical protein ACFFX1_11660 [Dactylosporangium sucinum]|uniref:Protein kinase domain-containing protein n=1 Tax=Dactylosporangium sucinum TaxID=1424081 RepID=A0A917WTS2_9ACTN|nr:hypothetical protein [Dactylosporangium sucinum]GGM27960.1 hypothetical protein GCM10007977_031600 [Dactylosporangium sucinum]
MDSIDIGYWVEYYELRDLRRLGWRDAGNSTLYECTYGGEQYVYKEYSEDFRADADSRALGRLIAWRDGLNDNRRDHLDRTAAWPRFRVHESGLLLGVLVPFAAAGFYRAGQRAHPQTLAGLVRYTVEGQVRPGAPDRVKTRAIGHAAEVLQWFHQRQVLVNDVRESNILCTDDGAAVYYVDCDVMIGPWGSVGSPAAPDFIANLVPSAARPTPASDFARLAWVAIWLLRNDFSLSHVQLEQLTPTLDVGAARLLVRTSGGADVDMDEWRRLAARWTGHDRGQAPVETEVLQPEPEPEPEPGPEPGPEPVRVPTRRFVAVVRPPHPSRWVPTQYRRATVLVGNVPRQPPAPPAAGWREANLVLVVLLVVMAVVCSVGVLWLLMQGVPL